jgi:hypothetical protein
MYVHINRNILQYLLCSLSPRSRPGRSSQPHHAYSSPKRNRKETTCPSHRSSATRRTLRLVFDATDSRCAAGTADVVRRTTSTAFVLATHEPAVRTRISVLRACRVESCSRSRRGDVTPYSSNCHAVRDERGAVACWAGCCVAVAANTTAAAQVVCRAHVESSRAAVVTRSGF